MSILSGCCKPNVGIMRDLVGSRAQPEAQEAGRHISRHGIQLMIVMVVMVVVVVVVVIWGW